MSVVMPAFNGSEFLRKCIASILDQTFTEFELLIGDDASQEDIRAVVQEFADDRIRYSRRETNLGLFANLNLLLGEARGSIVRFVCYDDLLEPECLAEEVGFLDRTPRVGMAFCKTTRIDDRGDVIGACVLNDLPAEIPSELASQLLFYHGCLPGNLSTVCVRRQVLEQVGVFDNTYGVAADYEMWTRICATHELGVIHRRLVRLRQHPKQLSHARSSALASIAAARRIRATLLARFPPELRARARSFARRRQSVLEAHYGAKLLLQGRTRELIQLIKIMGWGDFLVGAAFWLLTANNRIYEPRADAPLLPGSN